MLWAVGLILLLRPLEHDGGMEIPSSKGIRATSGLESKDRRIFLQRVCSLGSECFTAVEGSPRVKEMEGSSTLTPFLVALRTSLGAVGRCQPTRAATQSLSAQGILGRGGAYVPSRVWRKYGYVNAYLWLMQFPRAPNFLAFVPGLVKRDCTSAPAPHSRLQFHTTGHPIRSPSTTIVFPKAGTYPPGKCPRHARLAESIKSSRSSSELAKQAPVLPSVRRWVARVSSPWTSARWAAYERKGRGHCALIHACRSSMLGHSTSSPAPRCPSVSPSGQTGHSTSRSGHRRRRGSYSTQPMLHRERRTRGEGQVTRARRRSGQ